MKQLFLILLVLVTTISFSQNEVRTEDWEKVKNQDFEALVNDLDINFAVPANFSEKPLVENENVLYQKAYTHDSTGFEMRIWIKDLREQPQLNGLSENQFSESYRKMKKTAISASGGMISNPPKIMVYDRSTSVAEYNADWVASSVFIPTANSFNTDFEVCSILGITKNDFAEVYVFFMISDYDTEAYLMSDLIQVLTFKKEGKEAIQTR